MLKKDPSYRNRTFWRAESKFIYSNYLIEKCLLVLHHAKLQIPGILRMTNLLWRGFLIGPILRIMDKSQFIVENVKKPDSFDNVCRPITFSTMMMLRGVFKK